MQNPFKTHDVSDFPGVYVPMENAPRYQPNASGKMKHEDDSDTASMSTSTTKPVFTLESLRAEIDEDLAAGGLNTAYDRRLLQRYLMHTRIRLFEFDHLPHAR